MDSTKKTVLITGSSRGIATWSRYDQLPACLLAGLHFKGHPVGDPQLTDVSFQLTALSPFKIVTMDTADEATILEAARQLDGVAIDLLINNAGIGIPGGLISSTKEAIMRQFEVNTVGPFLVTRTLLPNLRLAAKTRGSACVAQLSSLLGSIGSCTVETAATYTDAIYGYGSSKAALNMITRSMSAELRESNIAVVSLHPGYVDTDMTQGKATLKPSDSVTAMTSLIAEISLDSTGKFFNLDPQIPASELPW
ncbi:unnamed protein product [Phytophthora fragariaefolia]|uniref:Unnamed protein product n=1 Tax=Phytophthora fragariaefolia TaxID=1490495 RepID=A0A9W7D0Z3_9STRA|nr:unnamed protein product [Phytophthora fragariaefolia]